jgi:hypothetical protein
MKPRELPRVRGHLAAPPGPQTIARGHAVVLTAAGCPLGIVAHRC